MKLRALLNQVGHGHSHGPVSAQAPATTVINLRIITALAIVVLIDGAIIGVAVSAGGAAALPIAIALSIELLFVAASTAGSTRGNGGSIGTAIGVGSFVAVMMPIGAAALLFTAVMELLVEAYEITESTGTIAMAAAGFLLFLILMTLM